jgi:sugar phosphate isomerase/epimerase
VRLACSTASFPQDRLETATAKAAWAGFPAVEIAPQPDDYPDPEALRRRLRADELELAAVHAGSLSVSAGEGTDPAAASSTVRAGRLAVTARSLDCSLLIVEPPAEGSAEQLAGSVSLLLRTLAGGGLDVDVCLCNRRGTCFSSPAEMTEVRRRVQDAGVSLRLALHPVEAVLAGWDPFDLDALPELPRHVYLSDYCSGQAVPPGTGDFNWPRMIDELRARAFDGTLSLLLENADPWAVEPVARETRELAALWLGE